MGSNDTRYSAVYHEIVTDIYTGVLPHGAALPTLMQLCEQYGVGRNTVRSAVLLLAENGYIELAPRRQPRVVFDYNNPACRALYIRELAQRQDAIADVYGVMGLLLPDLAVYCLQSASPAQRAGLADRAAQTRQSLRASSELDLFMRLFALYRSVFDLPGNTMLADLFRSLFSFIQTPLSADERKSANFRLAVPLLRASLKTLERQLRHENYAGLHRQIVSFCRFAAQSSASHLAWTCVGVPVEHRVEYSWSTGGKQETLYNSLVVSLLRELKYGRYAPGDELPSYAALAQWGGVSEKTSRKAVAILNQLGVVHTANGRRTQVLPRSPQDLSRLMGEPIMRQSMRLFLESTQLLSVLCGPVTLRAMKLLDQPAIDCMRRRMARLDTPEPAMDDMVQAIASPALHSIYQHVKQGYAWSAFLDLFSVTRSDAISVCRAPLARAMANGDPAQTAQCLSTLYREIFLDTKRYLDRHGLSFDLR